MLSPEDIKSIAASGEGYNAEFKASVPSKVREITEEVCAFSNAAGGIMLLGAIPKEEFGKRSHSRNPVVFGLFVRMHMVERIGSGINRIKDLVKDAGLPPPNFQTEGMFAASVRRPRQQTRRLDQNEKLGEKLGEKLSKNQLRIIEAMLKNNNITQEELANYIGISTTSIDNNIRKLRKLNVIARIGPAKGGYWKVNI